MAQEKEVVLITGGNTGLGFELARVLTRDYPHRFHVLLGCRTISKGEAAVKALRDEGLLDCEAIHIDVVDNASLGSAAAKIQQEFGRLDVLHVNAGIAPDKDLIPQGRPLSEILEVALQTNVVGAASTVEHCIPLLKKADNPRIIFTSSGAGSFGVVRQMGILDDYPAYSISKSALNMTMLWYHQKYGKEMRINATNPGFRATNLNNFGKTAPEDARPGDLSKGVVNAVRLTLLPKDGESGTNTQTNDETGQVLTVPW